MFSLSRMSWVSDDCTSERIPVSRDLAAATIDPHRLIAFACGFAIHAGLLPAGSLNHIRAAMGIPDSAFPGNALIGVFFMKERFGVVRAIGAFLMTGGIVLLSLF